MHLRARGVMEFQKDLAPKGYTHDEVVLHVVVKLLLEVKEHAYKQGFQDAWRAIVFPWAKGYPDLRELASDAPEVPRHLTFVAVDTINATEKSGSHDVTVQQEGTASNVCAGTIGTDQSEGVAKEHSVEEDGAADQAEQQKAAVLEDLVTSKIDDNPWQYRK